MSRYLGHAGEPGPDGRPLFPRDAVEAGLDLGALRVVLIGTHLSSRLSDPDGARRRLQAARLRELADQAAEADPEALVVAGGDLNDERGSPALAPLFADGGWQDVVGGDRSAGWTWSDGRRRETLDHLALGRRQGGRLVGGWVAAGPDVAVVSDHRPVVADLRAW